MTAKNALYGLIVCMGVLVYPHVSCTVWSRDTALQRAAVIARDFESLRLRPYYDLAGYPTIGYGHRLSPNKWVSLDGWADITQAVADTLLYRDLTIAEHAVDQYVKVSLSTGQRAALIDFVFNLGGHMLAASHLLYLVNNEQLAQVPAELLKWVHVGKMVEPGLVRRRRAEIVLWETESFVYRN